MLLVKAYPLILLFLNSILYFMKNYLGLLVVLFFVSCTNEAVKETTSKNTTETSEPKSNFEIMFDDFMLLDEAKMFRGIDFNMTISEVRKIERSRATTQENSSEKMDELFFEVDLSKEILDFANLKYSFAAKGLYFISAEAYFTNEKKSQSFYNRLETYFKTKYGAGEIADDGYLEFSVTEKKKNILIAIKEVNFPATAADKGSFGFFLVYSLMS